MKLSIITCTYNSEEYLQKCIDSVIAQKLDLNTYEHIFVDANSTDNTKNIIEKYAKKYPNAKVIERKPKGVYNAMNEGIKEAKGEYIMCLNSDDYLESNSLYNYLNYIDKTGNKDLYYAKLNVINGSKVFIVPNNFIWIRKIFFHLSCNVLVFHPSVLCKRETLIEMGLFYEDAKIASDFGMRLNFNIHHKTSVFYPHVVTNFVEHGSNLSTNYLASAKEVSFFRKKYYGIFGVLIDKILYALLVLRGRI